MDMPDLTNYIVVRLSDAFVVTPNDIIMEICEKTGLSWPEAEALVKQVQAEHEQDVTNRYAPGLGSHSRPIDERYLCNLFSNAAYSAPPKV